jgi:hypothetical protein
VIAATFPGGTITGCPKVRCMQIIAAVEGARAAPTRARSAGSNRDGDLDLNILIRTAEVPGRADVPHRRRHRRRLGPAARVGRDPGQGARAAEGVDVTGAMPTRSDGRKPRAAGYPERPNRATKC